jgi:flagellar hook-basal body complex protein FliE
MDDLSIRRDLFLPAPAAVGKGSENPAGTKAFGNMLADMIQDAGKLQNEADQAITQVQMGGKGSVHEAIIALEKADISFRTMLQVRNKILEAYQEVMRMQV